MPIQQLPMMKGMGKDFKNADYIDYLPINMLATPKSTQLIGLFTLIPRHSEAQRCKWCIAWC